MSFEPKILGFLCNWCSYAGADLAGVSRIQYPTNIRVLRVMCSGRVDPEFIFGGFMTGIDGIIIMGCHPGDCHYLEGNYEAEMKYKMVKKFLKFIDFENRVKLEWVSASEGNRFAEVVTKFTDQIRSIGSNPLSKEDFDKSFLKKLKAMKLAATSYRMRALVGKKRALLEQGNVYGEKIRKEKFNKIFDKAIYDEYVRYQVLLSLMKDAKTVKDLAIELEIKPSNILNHILVLKARTQVALQKIIGTAPLYISVKEG
ncbi:MAG: F420-non-reducing hydrogenase iron-sulfur subunit D [Promethearchaeota archaeon]|nr:MAG: F420-non-reducing hydrogenase iron-sulfur subunit D [Candidatus Lokiarchaeota archaeon]